MSETPPQDIQPGLPVLMRAARKTYGAAIRKALAEADYEDIPKNGIFVISAIDRGGAPLAQIIDALGVSKQSAGQLVDALVLRGYLDRSVDETDRRRLTITLSERGREAAKLTTAAIARVDRALIKKVGREKFDHTRTTLLALIALGQEGERA